MARTPEYTREITVERYAYGWRVEPPRAFVPVNERVTFRSPSGEGVELFFAPGAPVKAEAAQRGGMISIVGEATLTFAEPGYFPYAVFLTGSQVLATGASEPAVIVR